MNELEKYNIELKEQVTQSLQLNHILNESAVEDEQEIERLRKTLGKIWDILGFESSYSAKMVKARKRCRQLKL